jgi:serine/threonine protein kinase
MGVQTLQFGELALLEDFITREQLHATLNYQAERRDAAKPERKLGTLLVHQGYLTREEARQILRLQRVRGPIEGYVLLERLGSGGMGTVFRAIQKSLEREVALKILTPRASRHDRYRARFLQEAKLLAQLRHPNLVRAFEVGEVHGHLYFAMEYVRGRTARDLISRYGHLAEPEALDYMEQVAKAIEHYGAQRILHRDIKPENILITENGVAKLADLGLSKRLDEDAHITRPGKTLGTPLYISPELARGDDEIDIRSDLYSFGGTFYHLVTGVPPFEATASGDLLTAHVKDIPRSPREVNPLLSEELSDLLMRLLEKKPEKRFADGAALVAAIERVRRGEPAALEPLAVKLRARKIGASSSAETRAFRARDRGPQRGPGRRIGTASSAAIGAPSRKGVGAAQPSSRTGLIAAVVIAFAAAVGLVLATSRDLGGARVSAAGDPVAELATLASRDPQAALAEARAFEAAHPREPDLSLARYEVLLGSMPAESPTTREAAAGRDRVKHELDEAAAVAFEELKLDAHDLVDVQGKTQDALARIDAFPVRYRGTPAWAQRDELRRELAPGKP